MNFLICNQAIKKGEHARVPIYTIRTRLENNTKDEKPAKHKNGIRFGSKRFFNGFCLNGFGKDPFR